MKATTIKLEGELLRQLEEAKPESTSVTAFVREVLWRDLQHRKLSDGAVQYEDFVAENPGEQAWLREWHEADLATSPRRTRR